VPAQPAQCAVAGWPQVAQPPLGVISVAMVGCDEGEGVGMSRKSQWMSGSVEAFKCAGINSERLQAMCGEKVRQSYHVPPRIK
jgi:hypothetical protein